MSSQQEYLLYLFHYKTKQNNQTKQSNKQSIKPTHKQKKEPSNASRVISAAVLAHRRSPPCSASGSAGSWRNCTLQAPFKVQRPRAFGARTKNGFHRGVIHPTAVLPAKEMTPELHGFADLGDGIGVSHLVATEGHGRCIPCNEAYSHLSLSLYIESTLPI